MDLSEIDEVFDKYKIRLGRMISFSKSKYREDNPGHKVFFNANILTEEDGKIWWGDIDIDIDGENLNKISKELKKKLYILPEHEFRFENEKQPIYEAIKKAVWNSENW